MEGRHVVVAIIDDTVVIGFVVSVGMLLLVLLMLVYTPQWS